MRPEVKIREVKSLKDEYIIKDLESFQREKYESLKPEKGMKMKDPRTTVVALVTGVAGFFSYMGVGIPETWLPVIIGLGTVALGFFAGDSKPK